MDKEKKRPVSFAIIQFIDGQWITLIELETDGPATDEDIKVSIEKLKDLIMAGETVYITAENECVIINRKKGPIRVEVHELGCV